MKKRLCTALLTLALLLLSALALADVTDTLSDCGMTLTLPQQAIDLGATALGSDLTPEGYPFYMIYYYNQSFLNTLIETLSASDEDELTDEQLLDLYEALDAHSRPLLLIVLLPESAESSGEAYLSYYGYSPAEQIGQNSGYTYFASIPEMDLSDVDAQEREDYETCRALMGDVLNSIEFFRIEAASNAMPTFSAKDLDGNPIDNAIFSKAELTVLNVWGTFCTPCVSEMPELGAWSREMDDRVQLVGLVVDISGDTDTQHIALVKKILSAADADFVNIIANSDLRNFVAQVTGVPTTFFIGSDGTFVAQPIVGAYVQGYKDVVRSYFDEE